MVAFLSIGAHGEPSNPRPRRAIGIARVSVEGDRTEDRLYSYDTQAQAIQESCDREQIQLTHIGRERNVSGGADLNNRPELSAAIEAVERGAADLIIVAYFDRFFRSLEVQHQVISRVESAGGELLALDHGRLTNGSAAERLNSNVMGAVAQFYREQSGEKSRAGQAAAVARGAIMWSRVPLGLRKRADSTLEPDPEYAPLVREIFQWRADGASAANIARWLRDSGVHRSATGVQALLRQRLYIGELHFKQLFNLNACEPIVDRDLFERVQRMAIPRGPQAKSPRLLARLRVLRCGNCGGALGAAELPKQVIYRCPSTNIDCPMHVTINAETAETWVWDQVKRHLADATGRASTGGKHADLAAVRDAAQARLDHAVASFASAGITSEPASVAALTELRETRDAAQRDLDALPPQPRHVTVAVTDDLPDSVRRDLIRAAVRSVSVATSRGTGLIGADRMTIEFF